MIAELQVDAVNAGQLLALMSDGQVKPIVLLIDRDGYDTTNPSDARAAIVKNRDDSWITVDLDLFERVTLQ